MKTKPLPPAPAETLVSCARCQRGNFTVAGLKRHRCKGSEGSRDLPGTLPRPSRVPAPAGHMQF